MRSCLPRGRPGQAARQPQSGKRNGKDHSASGPFCGELRPDLAPHLVSVSFTGARELRTVLRQAQAGIRFSCQLKPASCVEGNSTTLLGAEHESEPDVGLRSAGFPNTRIPRRAAKAQALKSTPSAGMSADGLLAAALGGDEAKVRRLIEVGGARAVRGARVTRTRCGAGWRVLERP